jgi:hypothetical protein
VTLYSDRRYYIGLYASLYSVSREYSWLSALSAPHFSVRWYNITTYYLLRCAPFYLARLQLTLCYALLCPTVQHYNQLSTALRSTQQQLTCFICYLLRSTLSGDTILQQSIYCAPLFPARRQPTIHCTLLCLARLQLTLCCALLCLSRQYYIQLSAPFH